MKHQPHHQARHRLGYHHDGDPPNPLPHERDADYCQKHGGEYAPNDVRHPMQKRDRAKVHSSEKM
jgi:hypothetical protein